MLNLETYDDDTNERLSSQCLDAIARTMKEYGYTVCDVDEDSITFTAE
jgi:hypothetical protein